MWRRRLLQDIEVIIILRYEKYKFSLHIKDFDIRLKVRCEISSNNRHSDYCMEYCLEKEQQQVINS